MKNSFLKAVLIFVSVPLSLLFMQVPSLVLSSL